MAAPTHPSSNAFFHTHTNWEGIRWWRPKSSLSLHGLHGLLGFHGFLDLHLGHGFGQCFFGALHGLHLWHFGLHGLGLVDLQAILHEAGPPWCHAHLAVWEHPKVPPPNPTGASLGAAAKTQQWPKWLGSIILWHGRLVGVFLGLHLGGLHGIHGDLHGLHGFHGGKLRSHGCTGQEMDAPTGGGTGELGALEWLPKKRVKTHDHMYKHEIAFDCYHGNPYGFTIMEIHIHMLYKWIMGRY